MTPPDVTLPIITIPLPDVPYIVAVKRQLGALLMCPGITANLDKHQFLATFDEVQRIIPCPTCGASTEVPVQFRGLP